MEQTNSLVRTAALFSVGYAVVQPAARVLLWAMFRDPLPFRSWAEFGWFELAVAMVGAAAGALWSVVQRHDRTRSPGRGRRRRSRPSRSR